MEPFYQHLAVKAGFRILRDLDTPFSLGIYLLLKAEGANGIAQIPLPNPAHYRCPYRFRRDAFAAAYFRKLNLGSNSKLQEIAYEKWVDAEQQCKETNIRLTSKLGNPAFYSAKRFISRVLGPLDLSAIAEQARHGPGAAVGARGRMSAIHRKMGCTPSLTYSAIHLVPLFYEHAWIRAIHDDKRAWNVVPGNELVFVPKDQRADRPIAIEPAFNMYVQLGIGGYIRSRLRRFGIDLNHTQELHKCLAKTSSVNNDLVTLDLSSASDTVSTELIRELLPVEWFRLLDMVRSKVTTHQGKDIPLEKFSSMGNGFTFELETLVFLALCRTFDPNASVYGDDMIYQRSVHADLTALLRYAGLTINVEKTYCDSPFRESCGGDFFLGVPVRGVYCKKEPVLLDEKISLLNQLRQTDPIFFALYLKNGWNVILQSVPKKDRLFGPPEVGDSVIHSDDFPIIYKNGIRYVEGWLTKPVRVPVRGSASTVLAVALSGSGAFISPRGSRRITKRRLFSIR